MGNGNLGEFNLTFEQALVQLTRVRMLEFDAQYKPNIKSVKTWVLKDGPRAYKVATYWTFRDEHTLEIHHNTLTIDTLRRQKINNKWIVDEKYSIKLSDKDGDEIGELLRGLASVSVTGNQGDYIVIDLKSKDDTRVRQILDAISISGRKVDLLAEVVSWANDDPKVTAGLIQLAVDHPVRSKSLAAGLNYGRYLKSLNEFRSLVEENKSESVYQAFLENNIWMFGSEYAELIPKRALALGIQLDFPLRRTVDGYLEIIEIKTPLNDKQLFLKDTSHDNLYPRTELGQYIAQVRKYLRVLDAEQYRLQAVDKLLAEKVRAKVIIGRDHGDPQQLEALRQLNADQNRVEVITYDGLISIAERTLEILGNEASLNEIASENLGNLVDNTLQNMGDIPF